MAVYTGPPLVLFPALHNQFSFNYHNCNIHSFVFVHRQPHNVSFFTFDYSWVPLVIFSFTSAASSRWLTALPQFIWIKLMIAKRTLYFLQFLPQQLPLLGTFNFLTPISVLITHPTVLFMRFAYYFLNYPLVNVPNWRKDLFLLF